MEYEQGAYRWKIQWPCLRIALAFGAADSRGLEDVMLNSRTGPAGRTAFALALAVALNAVAVLSAAEKKYKKLKAEQLIALHLDSIGPEDLRTQWRSNTAKGIGSFRVLVGAERTLQGEAVFRSSGRQMHSGIFFSVSDYPHEQVSFDGDVVYLSQIRAGTRSDIGEFLFRYEEIVKEGLFGGTFSTGWPFLHMDGKEIHGRKVKLKSRGLKKLGDRKLMQLEYGLKRSSVKVRLYFDPDNYRHLSTVYQLRIPPPLAPAGGSQVGRGPLGQPQSRPSADRTRQAASRRDTVLVLEEHFADFREVQGFQLPILWKVRYSARGPGIPAGGITSAGTVDRKLVEWNFSFSSMQLNLEIPAKEFVVKQ